MKFLSQTAPYPDVLAELVSQLSYREDEGWEFRLDDDLQRDKPGRHSGESRGMTLTILRCGPDSYHPESVISVSHYFPVPPATFNRRSWLWWLFRCIGDVELHERMENFILVHKKTDGSVRQERPYPPAHGPGNSPYLVLQHGTSEDRRTSFRGDLNPE